MLKGGSYAENGVSASADNPQKMLKNNKKHPKIGCFYLKIVGSMSYNVNFGQFRLTFVIKMHLSAHIFNIFFT